MISSQLYKGLAEDNILCFAGAEEGIFCTLAALCEAEDHVIVLTPCYQSLLEIPKKLGCAITTVALQESNQWNIDIEAIRAAIRPSTKLVIINFPHNPTGQIIRPSQLQELINLLDQHGIWLFSDEVYRLLGESEGVWAEAAACLYDKAISLGVMSKSFGMAGLRIGWIACQQSAIFEQIERVKHYTSICNSGLSEIISIIALRNKDIILDRNNNILAENIKLLDSFMQRYAGKFSWVRPSGGCVGFVHYKTSESIDLFCKKLVENKGVLLMPASLYDVTTNHFRIGFGRINMPQALRKLEEFVELL
jgi:aspartate/methionine/tyrosine aminotransferase